ncbi:NACHT domain protein [compost metagenome]
MSINKSPGGGSAGSGGYDFQSRVIAYVAVFMLAARQLDWTPNADVPLAVSAETEGPGDDLRIELSSGETIEIQCKKGFTAGAEFFEIMNGFVKASKADPLLWCILAVDPTASKTLRVIRDDLDRMRDGREDGLSDATKRLIAEVDKYESNAVSALSKVGIIDLAILNDHESGVHLAKEMLGHRLSSPEKASAAWSYLVTLGLRLCRMRGRLSIQSLLDALQSNDFYFKPEDVPSVPFYMAWLSEITSTFRVPGVTLPMPIDSASADVGLIAESEMLPVGGIRTLQEAITKYREGDRLSPSSSRFDQRDLTSLDGNAVILASAGSGKTTLCAYLAHHLIKSHSVAKVRLPFVAKQIAAGVGIDDAIFHAATSGFAGADSALRSWLAAPAYLLADGFDECGPHRKLLAESIHSWALSRPGTTVILTSRPVGYDPALFADWYHLELLPLEEDTSEAFQKKVMRALCKSDEEANIKLERLSHQFKSNKVAEKAKKNPLLLGLMVWLSANNLEIESRRGPLFQQMLAKLPKIHHREPDVGVEQIVLDSGLDIAGAILQGIECLELEPNYDAVRDSMGDILAKMLGKPPFEGRRIAERCITYWVELGVLDRFNGGLNEFILFALPSFQEFAAARRLVALGDDAIKSFVSLHWRSVRHREVLLLASSLGKGEKIASIILEDQELTDSLSSAPAIAANMLSESDSSQIYLHLTIADILCRRLNSPIPRICYESATALLGLPFIMPGNLVSVVNSLLDSDQPWTRIAANRINLAFSQEDVDVNALCGFINEYKQIGHRRIRSGFLLGDPQRKLKQEILYMGAEILADRGLIGLIAKNLEEILTDGEVIWKSHRLLTKLLPEDARERINANMASNISSGISTQSLAGLVDFNPDSFWNEEFKGLIRLICDSFPSSSHGPTPSFLEIRKLLSVIGYWESSAASGRVVSRGHEKEAIYLIFRGLAARFGIQVDVIAREAAYALERLDNSTISQFDREFDNLPTPKSKQIDSLNLDPEQLARGLSHPSELIAIGAARLISFGDSAPGIEHACEPLLLSKYSHTLRLISLLAPTIWPDRALELVVRRLVHGDLNSGCAWFYEALPNLAGVELLENLNEVISCALMSGNSEIAVSIVESINSYPALARERLKQTFLSAFGFWISRRLTCSDCGCELDYSCGRCNLVKRSPLVELVSYLSKQGELSNGALLDLIEHPHKDVADEAGKCLIMQLSQRPNSLSLIFSGGPLTLRLLDTVLKIGGRALFPYRQHLLGMLDDPNPAVRERLVEAIAIADWIGVEQGISVARDCLFDEEPSVRDRALNTLRMLSASTQVASA